MFGGMGACHVWRYGGVSDWKCALIGSNPCAQATLHIYDLCYTLNELK